MNPTIKRYLVSSVTTFLATFLGVLALQIQAAGQSGHIVITSTVIVGVIAVAARAAVKAVVEAVPSFGSADK